MRRPVKYPLLVTRCARCMRRRACAPAFALDCFPKWLCRLCCVATLNGSSRALVMFEGRGK
jgi:hypothetical protein